MERSSTFFFPGGRRFFLPEYGTTDIKYIGGKLLNKMVENLTPSLLSGSSNLKISTNASKPNTTIDHIVDSNSFSGSIF